MDIYAMKNPLFGTQNSVNVSHTGFAHQLADAANIGRSETGMHQLQITQWRSKHVMNDFVEGSKPHYVLCVQEGRRGAWRQSLRVGPAT